MQFHWAGMAFLRHNILPWELLGIDDLTPCEKIGWLAGIMQPQMQAEADMRAEREQDNDYDDD